MSSHETPASPEAEEPSSATPPSSSSSADLAGIPPKLSFLDYLWIVLASFALGVLVSLSASLVMHIIVTSIVALLAGFVVTWIVTREFVPNVAAVVRTSAKKPSANGDEQDGAEQQDDAPGQPLVHSESKRVSGAHGVVRGRG
jgi:hypothetical protein